MRIAWDAVIGDLRVGDIRTERRGHVARSTVELIAVMLCGEFFAVAGDTFAAEICHAILRRDGLMWVVTGSAGERVAGLSLAGAFGEGLELARGAETGRDVAGEHVVADVGEEIVSGLEIVDVFAGTLDGRITFEVALHADLIAKGRGEFGGIDGIGDGRFGVLHVDSARAMTAFAGDAGIEEGRAGVVIVGACKRRAEKADVAVETRSSRRKVERHGIGGAVGWRHVPKVAVGVIVNGGFEEEAVGGEEVGSSTAALADVVKEFAGVMDVRVAGAVEAEDHFAVFAGDFVMDAGRLVRESAGDEVLRGLAAGISHRRA